MKNFTLVLLMLFVLGGFATPHETKAMAVGPEIASIIGGGSDCGWGCILAVQPAVDG